jgi:hypothetical protein
MHYTRSLSIWGDHVDKAIFLPFLPQNANIPIETQLLQALNLENDLASRLAPPPNSNLNAIIGPMSVLAYRNLTHKLDATDWFDRYDLVRREKLTNFLEAQARANISRRTTNSPYVSSNQAGRRFSAQSISPRKYPKERKNP